MKDFFPIKANQTTYSENLDWKENQKIASTKKFSKTWKGKNGLKDQIKLN